MIYAENIFITLAAPMLVAVLFLRSWARRYTFFFVVGMACCLLGAYLNSFTAAVSGLDSLDAVIVIAPIAEEIVKYLPMLYLVMIFEPSPRYLMDSAIAIGVGFATFENACFLTQNDTGDLLGMALRGLAVGAMHIGCTALLGIGLNYSRQTHWPRVTAMTGILTIAIIYHALYNLLVSFPGNLRYVGYALPLLVALVTFALYKGDLPRPRKSSQNIAGT